MDIEHFLNGERARAAATSAPPPPRFRPTKSLVTARGQSREESSPDKSDHYNHLNNEIGVPDRERQTRRRSKRLSRRPACKRGREETRETCVRASGSGHAVDGARRTELRVCHVGLVCDGGAGMSALLCASVCVNSCVCVCVSYLSVYVCAACVCVSISICMNLCLCLYVMSMLHRCVGGGASEQCARKAKTDRFAPFSYEHRAV